MNRTTTIDGVREHVRTARRDGREIAFVPTMGYLHQGHLAMVDAARTGGAFVVVSIFVNPTQFGDARDLDAYPRDEERDSALLEERGADLVFLPDRATIYPEGFATNVSLRGVALPLEGESRPGHFDGVATVVTKLFNIVQPDVAWFGEKDAQQCAVVRRLVRDLDFPIRIETIPTVREDDGLAMSSRNVRLGREGRERALVLSRSLEQGSRLVSQGRGYEVAEQEMVKMVEEEGAEVDYLRVVDSSTFQPPGDDGGDILVVGAIRIDGVRLIDNMRAERQLKRGVS